MLILRRLYRQFYTTERCLGSHVKIQYLYGYFLWSADMWGLFAAWQWGLWARCFGGGDRRGTSICAEMKKAVLNEQAQVMTADFKSKFDVSDLKKIRARSW